MDLSHNHMLSFQVTWSGTLWQQRATAVKTRTSPLVVGLDHRVLLPVHLLQFLPPNKATGHSPPSPLSPPSQIRVHLLQSQSTFSSNSPPSPVTVHLLQLLPPNKATAYSPPSPVTVHLLQSQSTFSTHSPPSQVTVHLLHLQSTFSSSCHPTKLPVTVHLLH